MGGNGRRAADDQRRARFVNQDGIDFIDNRVVITPLDLLFARRGHPVIAQIIEAELAVRSVSNVHRVLFATNIRLLIMLNAANSEPKEIVELPNPFRVTSSQVIVYRDKMRAASGECIEIKRQSRHQG